MTKTEAILFTNVRSKKAKEEILTTRLVFGGQKVWFDNQATRWLEVWLDSKLTFASHIRS